MRNDLSRDLLRLLAMVSVMLALTGYANAQKQPIRLAGAACSKPQVLHCPEKDCTTEMVTNGGPVVEPKTGRNYFLDYPCDLKKKKKVTFILSLHGGGSYGNWQRHYFPLLDYVDKYRLVVATPFSPRRVPSDTSTCRHRDFVVEQPASSTSKRAGWRDIRRGTDSKRLMRRIFRTVMLGQYWRARWFKAREVRAAILAVPAVVRRGKPPGSDNRTPSRPAEMRLVAMLGLPSGFFAHYIRVTLAASTGLPATRAGTAVKCGSRPADGVGDTRAGYITSARKANPILCGIQGAPARRWLSITVAKTAGSRRCIRIAKDYSRDSNQSYRKSSKRMLSAKGARSNRRVRVDLFSVPAFAE